MKRSLLSLFDQEEFQKTYLKLKVKKSIELRVRGEMQEDSHSKIEITLRDGCSLVNLLHIFLRKTLVGSFCISLEKFHRRLNCTRDIICCYIWTFCPLHLEVRYFPVAAMEAKIHKLPLKILSTQILFCCLSIQF